MVGMPGWEIACLIILGIMLLVAAFRFGLIELFFDILGAILGGSGGGGGSSFGGGSSGGGGSSSDDD
jgi:uncharacterized membrane protein YgcG